VIKNKSVQITLAMVLSVDGKSTKWDLPDQSWASSEDKTHLIQLISGNNLILMGGNTYQIAKKHIKPKEGKKRVVLTRNPGKFQEDAVRGQLEFTDKPVEDLIRELESEGFDKLLLLSGEKLNYEFFSKKLINEVVITLEPKIFGEGKGLAFGGKLDIELTLLKSEQLNETGTLLLSYGVSYK
jgi:dihydrofolate reductase